MTHLGPVGVLPPAGPLHLMFPMSLDFRMLKNPSLGGQVAPQTKSLNFLNTPWPSTWWGKLARQILPKVGCRPTPSLTDNGNRSLQRYIINNGNSNGSNGQAEVGSADPTLEPWTHRSASTQRLPAFCLVCHSNSPSVLWFLLLLSLVCFIR